MKKHRQKVTIEKINESTICYDSNPPIHISEYYNYCVKLLKNKLFEIREPINIIFGLINYKFNNENLVLKIDIQCEHTLVKDGGRGVTNKYFGKVKTDEGDCYLVRIDKYDYLKNLDLVIDYSIPNIVNISESGYFDEYAKKTINISPLMYELNFDNTHKTNTITLFTNNFSDRRNLFLTEINKKKITCINVDNCYSGLDLIDRYKTTKILVNVHQTDHHHTFEELRILPALSNGVIIISETVPLKEYIPYSDYIVWSKYNDLTDTIKDVQNNYKKYYEKIFGNKNLELLLLKMGEINNNNLDIITIIIKKASQKNSHTPIKRWKALCRRIFGSIKDGLMRSDDQSCPKTTIGEKAKRRLCGAFIENIL